MSSISRVQRTQGWQLKALLVIVLLGAVAVLWFGSKPSLAVDTSGTGVAIAYKGWFIGSRKIEISFADVQKVQLFAIAPAMRKVNGSDYGSTRVGDFATDQLGTFQAAISDEASPAVYVKTKDQAVMFTPDTDAAALKATIESQMQK